ncbi:hypothetical protein SOVF_104300 [Spinacia oleracea]|nr:hypothetical protein SOVF_104300 [Spinacia oleracea]
MSPNSIAQLNKKISASQRSAIENIGFGDLLSLKISKLPLHLGLLLVESFDANSYCLRIHGNEFFITDKDVHEVLGLPLGGEEINLENDCKDLELLDCWKKQFKKFIKEKAAKKANKAKVVKGESVKVKETFTQLIPVGVLTDHLKTSKSASDMWLRNYVVLVTSILIHGGQNQFVNCWILREVLGRGRGKMVCWIFDISDVAIEKVRIERSLPIIKGWNCNMLSTRERLEIELGRIAFHGMNDAVDKGETSGTRKDCILELAAANELAMAMEKFQLKAQQAYSDFPDDQRIQSLRDSASVVWDNYSSTNNVNQTENVVTPNPNITEKQSEIPREEPVEIPREEPVPRFSQYEDEEFWRNPIVLKAWDDIVEKGMRSKNARRAEELVPPSFSLGIDSPVTQTVSEIAADVLHKILEDNELEVDENLQGIDTVKLNENALFEEAVFIEKEVAERELRLNRRRNQKKSKLGKGTCELNKRQKVENREVTLSKTLCSPYKDRMVNIKSALTPAQKAIVDYVLNSQEPVE